MKKVSREAATALSFKKIFCMAPLRLCVKKFLIVRKMLTDLLFENFQLLADTPGGVQKLRELILQLAVQGRLVSQDPEEESASVLLDRIREEKERLIKEGKIKKQKPLPEIKPEEVPFELPEGWEWVRIGYIFKKIIGGGTPDKSNPEYWGGDIPWASVKDIGKTKYLHKTIDHITEKGLHNSSTNIIPKESIIICTRMGLGKISISNISLAINQDLKGIELFCFVTNDFFYNYFIKQKIKGTGMTVGGIRQDTLMKMVMPLPPYPEQHRIVTKVNQLMNLCDELEAKKEKQKATHARLNKSALQALRESKTNDELAANWVRVKNNFRQLFTTPESVQELRSTILQLAVQGKLVPQNPQDEPASALLERIREEKQRLVKEGMIKKQKPLPEIKTDEVPFELPEGWEWCRVGNIAQLITSGSRGWARYYSDSGAIFVTMSNLSQKSYKLCMNSVSYVRPPECGEGLRTKLEENDLLISITGEVGKLGLIPPDFGDAYINQHTCLLRLMPYCRNRYFPEFMRSPLARFQFDTPKRGIKNSFRLSDVEEMIISLPPLPEQQRIVTKVDQLMALCDELEARLSQSQAEGEKLMAAVIEKISGSRQESGAKFRNPANQSLDEVTSSTNHKLSDTATVNPQPANTAHPNPEPSTAGSNNPESDTSKSNNTAAAILAYMQPGEQYTRSDIMEALGLNVSAWNTGIRELKEKGLVAQTGQKRWARYGLSSRER